MRTELNGSRSVKPDATFLRNFARVQTLQKIETTIANMTKIKIAAANKPIMSPELEQEIEAALMQSCNKRLWTEWGLDSIRKNGNTIMLYGPPGTGKTTIANYMSKRIGNGMATLNMKDIGGKAPGHTERMTHQFFIDCRLAKNKTIFMDECEAVIWDRNRAGSDSMWMVGVIDEILMQVASYPGVIIAATNQDKIVDGALKDRCFAVLQVGLPGYDERIRLWKQKIPQRFPLQLTTTQLERLADIKLSGRQIVNAIVREASTAIASNRNPFFQSLVKVCEKLSDRDEKA